jgi:NTE family protein
VTESAKPPQRKPVALALQGGGSHGAFAWGVLEALLDDGRFRLEGLSGTSAGGMNALAAAQGLAHGGDAGGAEVLERFWRGVHEMTLALAPLSVDPMGKLMGDYNLRTSPLLMLQTMFKPILDQFSPYTLNPSNANPLRDFVASFFDFDAIQASTDPKLFLAATHVETGKIKIFENADITIDSVMATSCLPTMFQAVSVDGESYWDGGFIANPAIYPLINGCATKDIIVVQLTKGRCPHVPKQRDHILERFSEITFNACLIREIRAIYFITNLIDRGVIHDPSIRRINLHIIKDEVAFRDLRATSAMNTDWDFLTELRHIGKKAGRRWIHEHFDLLGTDQPFNHAFIEDYI